MPALQVRPLARDTASCDTNGHAFLIPRKAVNTIKVTVDGDAYLGSGDSSSVPAAASTNTTYLPANSTEAFIIDQERTTFHYVYVYAVSGSVTAKLSYYGA